MESSEVIKVLIEVIVLVTIAGYVRYIASSERTAREDGLKEERLARETCQEKVMAAIEREKQTRNDEYRNLVELINKRMEADDVRGFVREFVKLTMEPFAQMQKSLDEHLKQNNDLLGRLIDAIGKDSSQNISLHNREGK